jgi:hypothetical protein
VRKTVAVPLLALALTLPAAAPALASGSRSTEHSGHSVTDDRTGRAEAGRLTKPTRVRFAQIGTVTAVDPTAGTVTLVAKGGKKHQFTGSSLTVSVTDATAIRRNGEVATLADLVVGDRLLVEGTRTSSGYVALRLRARSAKTGDVVPTPEPTDSPTATAAPVAS